MEVQKLLGKSLICHNNTFESVLSLYICWKKRKFNILYSIHLVQKLKKNKINPRIIKWWTFSVLWFFLVKFKTYLSLIACNRNLFLIKTLKISRPKKSILSEFYFWIVALLSFWVFSERIDSLACMLFLHYQLIL